MILVIPITTTTRIRRMKKNVRLLLANLAAIESIKVEIFRISKSPFPMNPMKKERQVFLVLMKTIPMTKTMRKKSLKRIPVKIAKHQATHRMLHRLKYKGKKGREDLHLLLPPPPHQEGLHHLSQDKLKPHPDPPPGLSENDPKGTKDERPDFEN